MGAAAEGQGQSDSRRRRSRHPFVPSRFRPDFRLSRLFWKFVIGLPKARRRVLSTRRSALFGRMFRRISPHFAAFRRGDRHASTPNRERPPNFSSSLVSFVGNRHGKTRASWAPIFSWRCRRSSSARFSTTRSPSSRTTTRTGPSRGYTKALIKERSETLGLLAF